MQFREYRRKETIRAAEITVERLIIAPAHPETLENAGRDAYEFMKGDYAELRDDKLLGWRKADFESAFAPIRAPRQSKQSKPRTSRKVVAKAAGVRKTSSGRECRASSPIIEPGQGVPACSAR